MSKRIKFYTDEHVPNAVVKGLRLSGIDILTTKESNMLGAPQTKNIAPLLTRKEESYLHKLIHQVLESDEMKNHIEFL